MNTREHQFDEQWRQKLHDFGEDPDEGLIDQIQVKKDRMINLYKLTPYLVVGMLVTLIGISCFLLADALTGNSNPEGPAKGEQHVISAPANNAEKSSLRQGHTRNNSNPQLANAATQPQASAIAAARGTANTSSIAHTAHPAKGYSANNTVPVSAEQATAVTPEKPLKEEKQKTAAATCTADFDYYTSYNGELNFISTSDAADELRMKWNFGDGNEATTAGPAHRYSSNGTYPVSISFFAGDHLVCSKQKEISYRYYGETKKNKSMTGVVFEDSYLSDGAIVILHKLNTKTSRYEFSGSFKTETSGRFSFSNLENGRYLVSATRPDRNFIPTFYGDVSSPENANAITLGENDNATEDIVINLLRNTGAYDMGGTTTRNNTDTGRLVLLLDKHHNVVATVRTNRNGKPQLETATLPPGRYIVLDPETGTESSVDIGLNGAGSNGGTSNPQGGQRPLEQVKLIPNPAISNIRFDLNLDTPQDIYIRIINSSGIEVFADTRSGNMGTNTLNVLIDEFPPGVYYVLVKKGNADPVVSQLIKK